MTSAPRITIQGWHETEGATYDVATYNAGRRNRRNRWSIDNHGDNPGSEHELPAHEVVIIDGAEFAILLNRGYEYEIGILIDAEQVEEVTVDARDDYRVYRIPDGLDVLSVDVLEGEPSTASDDDDDTSGDEDSDSSSDEPPVAGEGDIPSDDDPPITVVVYPEQAAELGIEPGVWGATEYHDELERIAEERLAQGTSEDDEDASGGKREASSDEG